jgi:hypothetical protein
MRRAAIVLAVCCLAGCGAGGEQAQDAPPGAPRPEGDFGPVAPGHGERARPVAPPRKQAPAAVTAELDGGTVGVVGVDGAIGVRPSSLSVSSDGMIEDLEWSSWGSSDAVGDGRMRVLDCDPTCAGGGVDHVRVRIELSAPRLCGRATYFDRAVLSGAGATPPTSYVRAPC